MEPDHNNTVIAESHNLTIEELQEEYLKISKFYSEIKKTNDSCMQNIYELKRNLNTANAAERFLTQELESMQLSHKDDMEQLNEKYRTQLNDTKHRSHELSNMNAQLELKVEELEVKLEKLEQELLERNDVSVEVSSTQFDQKEIEWEKKTSELSELCTELGKRVEELESQIYKLQTENSCLKERLECAEDNFYSKKEEVQEKDAVIDGLHEKLIELSAELNEIKNSPPEQRKKGNSLFAEVDDQRQHMKNILAKQKKQYGQMQKQFCEREYEIHRLKRLNAAIHKEMEICSSIFTKADTNYRNELQKRIKGLLDEQNHLEEKLKLNEKLLSEMSNNKGMNWVDTIMSHCKNETEDIKKKYHSCLLEKSFIEENYLKSQQTLAKWRFEALKSRCIILDRENKLTEHKIQFDTVKFTSQESELQHFEPIVSYSRTTIKPEEKVPVYEQPENSQNSSSDDISAMAEIKTGIDVKLDLSDENIATFSPRPSIKSEKMDTSEDNSVSESSSCEPTLSPKTSPPPSDDNKKFSIFCDSMVELAHNPTNEMQMKPKVQPQNMILLPPENIKMELDAKPIKLEKVEEISNSSIKKKNNLIIRKVFIKSKK